MKKKDTVITFISAAALLGLFTIANDQNTAFADTNTPQNVVNNQNTVGNNQQTTQSIDQHDEQQDNTDNSTNQIEVGTKVIQTVWGVGYKFDDSQVK